MQGEIGNLPNINITVSKYLPDDTIVVSENLFRKIKEEPPAKAEERATSHNMPIAPLQNDIPIRGITPKISAWDSNGDLW